MDYLYYSFLDFKMITSTFWPMVDYGAAIRKLRKRKDLTQAQVAAVVGISPVAVSKKESGEISVKESEIPRFATALGVSPDELIAEAGESPTGRQIPIINRGPAGSVIDYERLEFCTGEHDHRFLQYEPRGDNQDPLAFGVIVVGDSMEPMLFEGDVVILTPMSIEVPRSKLEDGDVVLAQFSANSRFGPGCTLARWYYIDEHMARLVKDNVKYAERKVSTDQYADLDHIAKVVEVRHKRIGERWRTGR